MDFDPFKPDASTPIGQTQSPISQVLLNTLLILLKQLGTMTGQT